MQINPSAMTDLMEMEGLRLVDLHQRIVEQDPEGKGVSLSFLSELRSGTKTEASARTVRLIADALNVRVKTLASNPNDVAA